ncbi:MAG: alpha/beta fold hydrolase [Microcoleaceae cyanobacterium]
MSSRFFDPTMNSYQPPFFLKNGTAMTVYLALKAPKNWQNTISVCEPIYQEFIFQGLGDIPIFAQVAIPKAAKGTIIGTYGITGDLDNQWILKLLGRKAYSQGYAVVLFDWRAHGKTAELSPTLTSDGLYEGKDFVKIAAQAKKIGCPAPFWFTGYSLGGQLALWGVQAAETISEWGLDLGLNASDIGGGAVICPSLDSNRSLTYLMEHPVGKHLEQAITKALLKLAKQIHYFHPQAIDLNLIEQVNSIREFDEKLVIPHLGFKTVEAYYHASSPLLFLPQLKKPTLILYAADDPLFEPTIVTDLQQIAQQNSAINLLLTRYGGHVGYISRQSCQQQFNDPDQWWAWNRILEWCNQRTKNYSNSLFQPSYL